MSGVVCKWGPEGERIRISGLEPQSWAGVWTTHKQRVSVRREVVGVVGTWASPAVPFGDRLSAWATKTTLVRAPAAPEPQTMP